MTPLNPPRKPAERLELEQGERLRALRPLYEQAQQVLRQAREQAWDTIGAIVDITNRALPTSGEQVAVAVLFGEVRGLLAPIRASEEIVDRYESLLTALRAAERDQERDATE